MKIFIVDWVINLHLTHMLKTILYSLCLGSKHNAWIKQSSIHYIYKISYGTDPVKLIPDKCGDAVILSPNTGPSAGIKLTTPGGTPASVMIS